MADTVKLKDDTRAIGNDVIARARKERRGKLLWMAIGWALLIGVIVLIWSCLSEVFAIADADEVPAASDTAEETVE